MISIKLGLTNAHPSAAPPSSVSVEVPNWCFPFTLAMPQACSQPLPSATPVSLVYFAEWKIICLGQSAHWCLGICPTCSTIRGWTNLSTTAATGCPDCICLCNSVVVQNSPEFLANLLRLAKQVALSFASIHNRVGDIPVAKEKTCPIGFFFVILSRNFLHSLPRIPMMVKWCSCSASWEQSREVTVWKSNLESLW